MDPGRFDDCSLSHNARHLRLISLRPPYIDRVPGFNLLRIPGDAPGDQPSRRRQIAVDVEHVRVALKNPGLHQLPNLWMLLPRLGVSWKVSSPRFLPPCTQQELSGCDGHLRILERPGLLQPLWLTGSGLPSPGCGCGPGVGRGLRGGYGLLAYDKANPIIIAAEHSTASVRAATAGITGGSRPRHPAACRLRLSKTRPNFCQRHHKLPSRFPDPTHRLSTAVEI